MSDMINDAGEAALDEAISLSGLLPLRYVRVEQSLSDAELLTINEHNLMLLNAIEVAEVQRFVADSDADDGVQTELLRLEAKIDLLMGMMNQLLSRQLDIPPLQCVSLHAAALNWSAGVIEASIGEFMVVELHIHHAVVMPLKLPLRVTSSRRGVLYGLSPLTQNALDKFLFRQHRRAIAVSRQAR